MNSKIQELNQRLIDLSKTPIALGLSGKMGYSLYFYTIGLTDSKYTEIAESLLDSVCINIQNYSHSLDLERGLPGIGLGINYLVKKKFVCGDINQILQQFDDTLFKMLIFPRKKLNWFENLLSLYYYSIRIRDQKPDSEREYIYKKVIYKILNEASLLSDDLFEEPYIFSLEYKLPIFLFVLSELYQIDFFQNKIKKIIDEITHKTISQIPVLHSHKIYLALGMSLVSKQMSLPAWEKHIFLIKKEIEVDLMFKVEFREKNLFFKNGLTGIIFLIIQFNKLLPSSERILFNPSFIEQRIKKTDIYNRFLNERESFANNSGLFGFCSLSLLENHILQYYGKI